MRFHALYRGQVIAACPKHTRWSMTFLCVTVDHSIRSQTQRADRSDKSARRKDFQSTGQWRRSIEEYCCSEHDLLPLKFWSSIILCQRSSCHMRPFWETHYALKGQSLDIIDDSGTEPGIAGIINWGKLCIFSSSVIAFGSVFWKA